MKLKAFAKINFWLKVVGLAENGYHNLQMLNAKIDLYDEILITKNQLGIDTLSFLNSPLNPTKDDLVLKAFSFVKDLYGINDTFDIQITKHIPIGAGLGGGSADAGCVIKYLLDIYHIAYDEDELNDKLKNISADLPYALWENKAFVENIGEKITKVDWEIPQEVIIVYPNIVLSTKDVFNTNTIISKAKSKKHYQQILKEKGFKAFENDLTSAAFKLSPKLEKLYLELKSQAFCVMSGSGSSFILISENLDDIYHKLKKEYKDYFIRKVKVLDNGK